MVKTFDQGSGVPLIVIPGVQGRWEWMRPGLCALARRCRTISYTLAGDMGSGRRYDPALGFDSYMRQLDDLFAEKRLERAALCGISYGGLIALRYAATRPERVTALVIASSPAPGWRPNDRQSRYIARPWRSAPAFVATAPGRLFAEIRTALDTWPARIGFTVSHGVRALRHPMIPSLMAGRVTLQQAIDFTGDCLAVRAPTLVLTGEPTLDQIVPVGSTRRFAELIPGAQHCTLERTGHLGCVTQPDRFARLVGDFVSRNG